MLTDEAITHRISQQALLLREQKKVASELDHRVAQRTTELAAANEMLRKEIAERKEIENRLLASEALLKKSETKLWRVIDTIPALAWCNLPDGPNEFLNKGWHEYTGLSPEESHGWGWQVAFHPEDLPPLLTGWQSYWFQENRAKWRRAFAAMTEYIGGFSFASRPTAMKAA